MKLCGARDAFNSKKRLPSQQDCHPHKKRPQTQTWNSIEFPGPHQLPAEIQPHNTRTTETRARLRRLRCIPYLRTLHRGERGGGGAELLGRCCCTEGGEVAALRATRLSDERGATHGAFAVDPLVLRTDLDGPACLEVVEQLDRRGGRQVLEEPVVDLDHRGVDAGPQALDLCQGEETVAARLAARLDAQMRLDGIPAEVGGGG